MTHRTSIATASGSKKQQQQQQIQQNRHNYYRRQRMKQEQAVPAEAPAGGLTAAAGAPVRRRSITSSTPALRHCPPSAPLGHHPRHPAARKRRVCFFRFGPLSLLSRLFAFTVINVALIGLVLRLYYRGPLLVIHQQQQNITASTVQLVTDSHHDTPTAIGIISKIIPSSQFSERIKKDAITGTKPTKSTTASQPKKKGGKEYDHDVTTMNVSMAFLVQDDHEEEKKARKNPTSSIAAALNSNKNESIAACLLTMDDNFFLIEWLAYHYHVLPLRHLIVAVDPRAKTSPQEIFDRWSGRINITVWNDTHIFAWEEEEEEEEKNLKNRHDNKVEKKRDKLMTLHRKRQLTLYEKCMRQFKSDGHQWVMLLDTDEFMVVHANHYEDIRWPGSVLKYLKEKQQQQEGGSNQQQQQQDGNDEYYYNTTTKANTTTSMSHTNTSSTPPCLLLPRRRYGTKESQLKFQDKHVPKGYNSSNFLTMRWRHYGMKDRDVLIKTMIDVSRVDWDDLHTDPGKRNGVHVPLDICGDKIRMSLSESKLIVSHYAGTWEQFSFRDDARKGSKAEDMISQEAYHKLKRFQFYHDDLHRDWLIGFIKSVGDKEAHRLLKDVGKVIT